MEAVFASFSFVSSHLLPKNRSMLYCPGARLAERAELTDLRWLLPEMLLKQREDSNIPVVGCTPFAAAGRAGPAEPSICT